MVKMKLEVWFWGLLNATIGGMASSASSWLGMTAAKAAGVDVPVLNLKALGMICLSGAATNFFFYLKQSPLPSIQTTSVTTTETIETKTTPAIPGPEVTPKP